MEFLYGLITGGVLMIMGYFLRGKIATYTAQEVQSVKDKITKPTQPPVIKP